MSAAPLERPVRVPSRTPQAKQAPRRTPLRLVQPRRSSAAKAPFVIVLVSLLVGGLLGLLLLNTLVAKESFALHDLSTQSKALTQQEQDLARQVQALQAPANLAGRATKLGMVPGGPPAFLRLSDGKVLGKPQAGVLPVVPKAVVPATTTAGTATTPATASTTWTAPKPVTKPATGAASKPSKPATKPTTGAHR
jgi:hypothetical protein